MQIKKLVSKTAAGLALAAICAGSLTSCSTAPTAQTAVFKFTVLKFREPIAVSDWTYDSTLSGTPEGAALNIVFCMEQGDYDKYLSNWDSSEHPATTPAAKEAWVKSCEPLKGGEVFMLDRIVADADIVIELSVREKNGTLQKVQLPLKHASDRWFLTSMDPNSDFLHWETSPNKIVVENRASAFENYLTQVKSVRPK